MECRRAVSLHSVDVDAPVDERPDRRNIVRLDRSDK